MAASAQPSANGGAGDGSAAGKSSDCSQETAVSDNPAPSQALKHNPGLAAEWMPEEQSILEEGLTKYASEKSFVRFAKIAMLLSDKTIRDVALRSRWMTVSSSMSSKRENGKRKKDDLNNSKKNNKKGVSDTSAKTSQMTMRPIMPPYPFSIPVENDDEVSSREIGGVTGELFEQNALYFNQISANFSSYQVQENIDLLWRIRDNIRCIINDMTDSGAMDQMPPLPTKVNEELANCILPSDGSTPLQS